MPNELLTAITTAVTLVLGWLLSEGSNLFKTSRQENIRKLARKEAKEGRQAEFRRETLLEVQDKLLQLSRSTFQIYFADLKAHNEGGDWSTNKLPEELAEKDRVLVMDLTALTARVADDRLREEIEGYRKTCTMVSFATSQDGVRQANAETQRLFNAINARLGELLRSTY